MIGDSRFKSEDYADFIVDYRIGPQITAGFENAIVHIMNDAYAILHIPLADLPRNFFTVFNYSSIPRVFGLASEVSVEASGVSRLRTQPVFNLTGNGVLIGIIDTGIDYQHPAFRKTDQTTKIAAIWDQTVDSVGGWPYNTEYGTEYRAELINQALLAVNPLDIVPSVDTNGHGTMMAGVAAGTSNAEVDFQGVSPDAELVIVKLRQAKGYLRDFFMIPEEAVCFQENDIMWAAQYCVQFAREVGRPIVICLGIGTSQTSHAGLSPLSNFLSLLGDFTNVGIVNAVGNEGNRARHFFSTIAPNTEGSTVELIVGENDRNFSMELWGGTPGLFSIDVLTPNNEYIPRIAPGFRVSREISFIFEETILNVDYELTDNITGDQLILVRFRNASPGTWRFRVYSQSDLSLGFHIWLPMGDFISEGTYFIQPNIYTTVLAPGTAIAPIAVTAYNPIDESLFVNASRGYTTEEVVKPEIAAPGVNYIAPALNGEYVTYTGTGVSTAHAAGVVALFLEWAVVRGNLVGVDTTVIKNYFIRGASRRSNIVYPNRDWGYGILNIFNVFDILRRNI